MGTIIANFLNALLNSCHTLFLSILVYNIGLQSHPPIGPLPAYIGGVHYIGMRANEEKFMRQQLTHHQPMPLFTASICSLIQLDREQSTPLYQQICEKLREAILSGQLSEGT